MHQHPPPHLWGFRAKCSIPSQPLAIDTHLGIALHEGQPCRNNECTLTDRPLTLLHFMNLLAFSWRAIRREWFVVLSRNPWLCCDCLDWQDTSAGPERACGSCDEAWAGREAKEASGISGTRTGSSFKRRENSLHYLPCGMTHSPTASVLSVLSVLSAGLSQCWFISYTNKYGGNNYVFMFYWSNEFILTLGYLLFFIVPGLWVTTVGRRVSQSILFILLDQHWMLERNRIGGKNWQGAKIVG